MLYGIPESSLLSDTSHVLLRQGKFLLNINRQQALRGARGQQGESSSDQGMKCSGQKEVNSEVTYDLDDELALRQMSHSVWLGDMNQTALW